jgi:arylsulfatase A-like enzyme
MKLRLLPVLVAAVTFTVTANAADRPNFILAMADDQGWGDMAYQGDPLLKTPVFDEMSRTALPFARRRVPA